MSNVIMQFCISKHFLMQQMEDDINYRYQNHNSQQLCNNLYKMSTNPESQKTTLLSHIPLTNPNSNSNPYQLLKTMNKVISDQKQQLEQYQFAFESLKKQRNILMSQKKKLQNLVHELTNKIEMMKGSKNNENAVSFNMTSKLNLPQSNQYKALFFSPTAKKMDYTSVRIMDQAKSGVFDFREVALPNNLNLTKRLAQQVSGSNDEQYIPQPVRLTAKHKIQPSLLSILNNTTLQSFNKNKFNYAENLMQAFMIVGPEISQLKRKRATEKGKDHLIVKPASLYCYGKHYKQNKTQFITQIARRAFPQGCMLKKKMFQQNQQLLDLIEYKPNRILSQDYFVFTLKGDDSLYHATAQNPSLKKSFLYVSNPNYYLFVVCLKLPDFIYIRDEKNYHRKENQIWIGQKIYAMVTYYPFFNIHTETLYRIHSIMSKILIRKILIQNQNILVWNMTKTVYDIQKNPQINQTFSYFINKKPDYNQVCNQSYYYFGTLPEFGFKSQYAMSLYCCPIFFSNFAYEEMLLMLTAIFCQKTLVFISKVQAMATLSALFLINLISPFQYSQQTLLNCDSDKVKKWIFQFPFPIICSIKKTDDNIEEILSLFAESNVSRVNQNDSSIIIVDVDSNTILYHHSLEKMFTQCIVEPDRKIRQTYLSLNPCQSKSFSLPKQLARQNLKTGIKIRSQFEKRQQQIKKNVKEYMQKITTNQTKIPIYRHNQKHENLLRMLTEYIQEFTLNKQNDFEIINKLESTSKNLKMQTLKNYMIEKKKGAIKPAFLVKVLNSQMFANYFDSFLNG